MKRVLDACCGSRMFWFDKNNPDVEFCDNRELHTTLCDARKLDIKPDTFADFTALPFPDNTFYHVVFDPPHFVAAGDKSWLAQKYGHLPKEWKPLLHDGFAECMRVLKPNGTLIFKWNEYQIPVREVIDAIGWTPMYGHKSGKNQKTHWLAFIKPPKEEE